MIEELITGIVFSGLPGIVRGLFSPQEHKESQNVKVDFGVEELELWFVCDDKNIGDFRVSVYNKSGDMVAYLEGKNHRGSEVNVGHNTNKYSKDFLFNSFHMCRCRREFERLGDINYSKGYEYFRGKLLKNE